MSERKPSVFTAIVGEFRKIVSWSSLEVGNESLYSIDDKGSNSYCFNRTNGKCCLTDPQYQDCQFPYSGSKDCPIANYDQTPPDLCEKSWAINSNQDV